MSFSVATLKKSIISYSKGKKFKKPNTHHSTYKKHTYKLDKKIMIIKVLRNTPFSILSAIYIFNCLYIFFIKKIIHTGRYFHYFFFFKPTVQIIFFCPRHTLSKLVYTQQNFQLIHSSRL